MTVFSDHHRLVFIHIPKCAGTTVMRSLKSFNTFMPECPRPTVHPRFGPINFDHVPLAFWNQYFPQQFDKIYTYDSYAVIREPRRRFTSALLQYARSRYKVEAHADALPWLLQQAKLVCEHLEGPVPQEYIIFQKQADFVFLERRRIVRHLYSLEELARFASDLKIRHDIRLDVDIRLNERRMAPSKTLRGIRDVCRPLYCRILSASARERLGIVANRIVGASVDQFHERLIANRDFRETVDVVYAEDAELYRSLTGNGGFGGGGEDR